MSALIICHNFLGDSLHSLYNFFHNQDFVGIKDAGFYVDIKNINFRGDIHEKWSSFQKWRFFGISFSGAFCH
jgi:hypothetical protein